MVLAVAAVLDPVGNVNSLTKPDQRLLFPAILIVLAVLPWKPVCPVSGVRLSWGSSRPRSLGAKPSRSSRWTDRW